MMVRYFGGWGKPLAADRRRPSAHCAARSLFGGALSIDLSGVLNGEMVYSYTISLQVRHPDADPGYIVSGMELPAHRMWKKGEPRTTPKGAPLEGRYRETYCVFDLGKGHDGNLAAHLQTIVETLKPKRAFLTQLRAAGGSTAFFVSWEAGKRGEVFDVQLLSDIAALGIALGIDPHC